MRRGVQDHIALVYLYLSVLDTAARSLVNDDFVCLCKVRRFHVNNEEGFRSQSTRASYLYVLNAN